MRGHTTTMSGLADKETLSCEPQYWACTLRPRRRAGRKGCVFFPALADVLGLMVKEGLVLVDDGEKGGPRLYWVPCTGIEPAIKSYRQQRGL